MQQWSFIEGGMRLPLLTKRKGGNHSANAVTTNDPFYIIWETKENISMEEFQEFIDGPRGPGFGLKA